MRNVISRVAILALTATLVYCGSKSSTAGSTGLTGPTGPTNAILVGVKISAPSSVAPGTSAQFSATGQFSDGSSKDVTATVTWSSSDTSVLTITNAGLATGIRNGRAFMTAFGTPTATAGQEIVVVPAGTSRLSGDVVGLDGGLTGALVQVSAGTGAGQSTTTQNGVFALYGVAGDVQVTVTQTDYVTTTRAVTVNDNNARLHIDLAPITPPPDVTGSYAVRITAAAECPSAAGGLSDIARDRQYIATIAPDTSHGAYAYALTASLTGATFRNFGNYMANRWFGAITPSGARFYGNEVQYYYSGIRDFAEVLPDGSLYAFIGTIDVRPSGDNLVGILAGTIRILTSQLSVTAECNSDHHAVTFIRQSAASSLTRTRR